MANYHTHLPDGDSSGAFGFHNHVTGAGNRRIADDHEHDRFTGHIVRWCRDCGHEAHPNGPCTYRMAQGRAIQLMARGKLAAAGAWPDCDCDAHERGHRWPASS